MTQTDAQLLIGRRVATIDLVLGGERGDYVPIFATSRERAVKAVWFRLPTGSIGRIASRGHGVNDEPEWDIAVEDDGAVTVSPSIQQRYVPAGPAFPETPPWHGFLEHGVWREA
jgi:hypothetical protein